MFYHNAGSLTSLSHNYKWAIELYYIVILLYCELFLIITQLFSISKTTSAVERHCIKPSEELKVKLMCSKNSLKVLFLKIINWISDRTVRPMMWTNSKQCLTFTQEKLDSKPKGCVLPLLSGPNILNICFQFFGQMLLVLSVIWEWLLRRTRLCGGPHWAPPRS